MERATKLFVFVWALVALAFEIHLVARGWGELQMLAALAFVAMFFLARVSKRFVAVVLSCTYVFPALIVLLHGEYVIFFEAIWMAALLGAMAPESIRSRWHVPAPWRAALICWALVVAAGAPLTLWREIDFDPALLTDSRWILWSSVIGVAPSFVATWILYVSLVIVIGILWFDWMFTLSPDEVRDGVVTPLVGSAVVMALAAGYQLFGHSLFLNGTLFGSMGRASGTMLDANLCGTVAALWAGGAVIWSERLGRARPYALAAVVALCATAVWAAGSRTGFVLLILVGAFAAMGLYLEAPAGVRPKVLRAVAAGGIALAGLGLVLGRTHPELVGPVRRLADMLPSLSTTSFANFASELWNRNRYGTAATLMIREFPWVGVGVGAFQILVPDYANASSRGGWITPDNAQNWYRHQLTEMGVVGSLGWIVWVCLFAWFVIRRRSAVSRQLSVWTLRGMLIGLALVSLVGMPTQDMTLAITFWTLAFWFVSIAGPPSAAPRVGWRAWVAILVVVLVYGAGTAEVGASRLRAPMRAQRFGWPYVYGFYDPEPDGRGGQFEWAARRGVAVIDRKGPWLAVTVSVNHQDLDRAPVDARVWCDGRLVLRTRLRSTAPVTEYVRVPESDARVLLETGVNRVVRPRDAGLPDDRELGLMVAWRFVDSPPEGATVVTLQ